MFLYTPEQHNHGLVGPLGGGGSGDLFKLLPGSPEVSVGVGVVWAGDLHGS